MRFESPWVNRAVFAISVMSAIAIASDPGKAGSGEVLLAFLAFLVVGIRALRSCVLLGASEITVRGWFSTRTVPLSEVVLIDSEFRWYLKGGTCAVLHRRDGRKVTCIGLSGHGEATSRKIEQLNALVTGSGYGPQR